MKNNICAKMNYFDKCCDEEAIKLLFFLNRYGSINRAARALGLSYSKAWNIIDRMKNFIYVGQMKRGGRLGGGTKLSEDALNLLKKWLACYRRIYGVKFGEIYPEYRKNFIYYRGSHDVVFNKLIEMLESSGVLVEVEWVGSLAGLSSLAVGESDMTGIHTIDKSFENSNVEMLKMYGLEKKVAIVRGYERLQCFFSRKPSSNLADILESTIKGEQTIALRPPATGTRLLFNMLLRKYLKERGIDERAVKLKAIELNTHESVAEAVNRQEADIGIGIAYLSKKYNLRYIPILWERFDFVFSLESVSLDLVKNFANMVKDREFLSLLKDSDGYRIPEDIGEIILL
ncbi:MAG: substrate-binding domain-containing protein [Fervidicoccaceae archaeon]|jgi:molybdate transport repressor ModE-like protein